MIHIHRATVADTDSPPGLSASGSRINKKLLMVDYYFPPMGGSGVRRTVGWLKYLHEHGWSPVVLTVRGGDASFEDPSLSNLIPPSVPVYRASSIEPIRFAKRVLRKRLVAAQQGSGSGSAHRYHLDWLRSLIPWVLDRHAGWFLPAIASGISALRSQPIDLIYSTFSDTISAHLVAYALKTISGKPWVADFQDPWSVEPYAALFPSALHRKIAWTIEQTMLRKSDHVIVAARAFKETYEREYPSIGREKISVIPIGYVPEPFQVRPSGSNRSTFRLLHFGVLWFTRSPAPFLKGLAEALNMNSGLAARIEVKFVGGFDPKYRDMTRQMLTAYGLERKVHLVDSVPYAAGAAMLLDSDVLLLIADNAEFGKRAVPCKLFDYLGAAKPILALTPDGEAARIVRGTNAGMVVDPDDVSQIAHAIVRLYEQWQEGSLGSAIDKRYTQQFSCQETTKSFVSILNRVLTYQQGPHPQ